MAELNMKVPFSSWKAFEALMNKRDKSYDELKEAEKKYKKLNIMVDKRAKYLGIVESN